MIRFLILLILGGIAIGFTNCSSTAPVSNTPAALVIRPNWVTKRPVDPNYYIGVAVASKTTNPTTYAIVAQRNALNELASSIEVKVKSNSMLFSFEEQNEFRDEFKEFVQIKTNQQLEHYEEVAVWESVSEYWIYYRLSKEQYKKDKQAKIGKAINMAMNYLKLGDDEWVKGNYRNGMIQYFEALKPIKPYLGEPLQVTVNGSKDVYLGNYILARITQGTRVFQIKAIKSQVVAVWGGRVTSSSLIFSITDTDGNKLNQIPVDFTYSEGVIRPRYGLSGSDGKVFTEIKKVTSTNNLQEISAQINFKKMILGKARPDEITSLIFEKITPSKAAIKLNVTPPKIYVSSSEKSFGKGSESSLESAFSAKATELGFILSRSKKNADIIVYINADTKEAGSSYGLNNAYLNASITITDNVTKSVLYQDKLASIKGVSESYKGASKEAYIKAAEQISKKIAPRFYRKYTS